jgi:hypothetical protein
MPSKKYWKMLDTDHPACVKNTAALASLSTNYDFPSPFSLFLDLIGWSEDNLGERLYQLDSLHLDYLAGSYLGSALSEYSDKPDEVTAWVTKLCAEETK